MTGRVLALQIISHVNTLNLEAKQYHHNEDDGDDNDDCGGCGNYVYDLYNTDADNVGGADDDVGGDADNIGK